MTPYYRSDLYVPGAPAFANWRFIVPQRILPPTFDNTFSLPMLHPNPGGHFHVAASRVLAEIPEFENDGSRYRRCKEARWDEYTVNYPRL